MRDRRNPVNVAKIRVRYIVLVDAVFTVILFVASLWLRYEDMGLFPQKVNDAIPIILLAVLVRFFFKLVLKQYDHIWARVSVREMLEMIFASTMSTFVLLVINFLILPRLGITNIGSYAILVVEWLLNLVYIGASRQALRATVNWLSRKNKRMLAKITKQRHVLIMGAGDVGTTVLRMIQENPEMGLVPVGFVDDALEKQSTRLMGIPVLGTRQDIPRLAKEHSIVEVIVAMPTASHKAIDDVSAICSAIPVHVQVIPNLYNLISGTISVDEMRQWRSVERAITSPDIYTGSPIEYKNLLVTGGAGFIGANFVHHMLVSYPNYRIVVFDKLTYAGNMDNLLGLADQHGDRYRFVRGDIASYQNVSEVMETYEIDAIVNFAAETHVDRSLMEPESFLKTNVYGVYTLLEAARQYRVARYHQVSTDEVYGQVLRGSFSEEDPLETRSPYSASKASGDLLAHAYYNSFGVPVTITRGSNNIGPYQYPEKAVPLFITNALEGQPLPVYGDGGYIRDYQYVLDHCKGIDFILHHGCSGEIYNIGGGNGVSALDLARMILDRLEKPQSLIYLVQDREGQDRRYSVNTSKIRAMGWKPEYTFEQSLEATIDWYLKNDWWWRKLKSGEYRHYYEKQYRQRLDQAVRNALITS